MLTDGADGPYGDLTGWSNGGVYGMADYMGILSLDVLGYMGISHMTRIGLHNGLII